MSAIAEILHHSSYKVQGSDAHSNNNTNRLKKFGIEVYIGHSAENINKAQIVVYSSAIKSDNVELVAAKSNNKTILHRSDILAELLKNKYVIAVSGSSGKTTTTAMIASIFDHSNIDATVIVGGILNSYQSNAKVGKGNIFLIEADESDGTMLKIPANIAVITSINDDHIDHYGTFDDIKEAFHQFINKADFAVLPDSMDINYDGSNAITFGFEGGNIKAINIRQHDNIIEFDVLIAPSLLSSQLVTLGSTIIKDVILSDAIGIHKVSNALAAISVAIKLGISEESIRKGLAEFKGVARRFSLIADVNGVKLIEDYAHHPDEIQATLTAARSITNGKIVGIIEPLRFARVRNFFNEFIRIFMMFDYVILTPVHPPEDEPIHGFGINDIQKALISNGFDNVKITKDSLLISRFINGSTNCGDIVLFIGAGSNIAKLAKETAEHMKKVKV
ncbi:UDP-N-acetylmuramate--L-alanine ligase [Wolbachia endosymbiont (group E) of Neria commutata]|uniref:UDP-N-acetylmuramate--L-alanine ligase n=1 Tax=Wolbachia endosymbiont (group E) of Neria commutata TaxID=3066149 RepID=UPI003133013F